MYVDGWERRLQGLVNKAMDSSYEIGKHDCALFAIRAVKVVCGKDFMELVEGKYSTERGSLKLIAKLSKGKGLKDAISEVVGSEPCLISSAYRGDPVLYIEHMQVEEGLDISEHIGICLGEVVAVLHEDGLHFVPITACECCWNVCNV